MDNEIALIFGKTFMITVIIILFFFLLHDIRYTVMYMKGRKTIATIVEKMGVKDIAHYGDKVFAHQYTVYKIRIEEEDGKQYETTTIRKEFALQPGWSISVRIYDGIKGPQVVNDVYSRRLLYLGLMVIGGLLLALFSYYTTR